MPAPLQAPMPPGLKLSDGYEIRFNAIDANGVQVTGVTVQSATLFADNLGGTSDSLLASGPFVLVSGTGG